MIWSTPAERSGDGALDLLVEHWGGCVSKR